MKFIKMVLVMMAVWTFLIWGAVDGHKKLDDWIHKHFPVQGE